MPFLFDKLRPELDVRILAVLGGVCYWSIHSYGGLMKTHLLVVSVFFMISTYALASPPQLRKGPKEAYQFNCKMKIDLTEEKVVPHSVFLTTQFEGHAEADFQITHAVSDKDVAYIIRSRDLKFTTLNQLSHLSNAASMDTVDTNDQEVFIFFTQSGTGWNIHLNLTINQIDNSVEQSSESESSSLYEVGQIFGVKGSFNEADLTTHLRKSAATSVSCSRVL
jgi:hypothetical protein